MAKFFARFSNRNNKPVTIEEVIDKIQKGDSQLQNEILEQYSPFIASTVSSVCKRYISEFDDEFSIGLIAFNEALEKFDPAKGRSVLSFAEIVIKNRIVDYIRKEAKNPDTINFSVQEFNNPTDDIGEYSINKIETSLSLEEYNKENEKLLRKEEIAKYQRALNDFGLSFSELLNSAPKHADARQNAIEAASTLIKDEELKEIFYETKKLPIKKLENLVSVSKKTIERNRKYIIALAIILDGEFSFLKEYVKKSEE